MTSARQDLVANADFVVVGAGIAGLSFVIAARRKGVKGRVVILERGMEFDVVSKDVG
jgi:flavin-dependent dehydrogenase